jgi:hypothetical protein
MFLDLVCTRAIVSNELQDSGLPVRTASRGTPVIYIPTDQTSVVSTIIDKRDSDSLSHRLMNGETR